MDTTNSSTDTQGPVITEDEITQAIEIVTFLLAELEYILHPDVLNKLKSVNEVLRKVRYRVRYRKEI